MDAPKVSIEYKGEAYALEKEKIYLIKIKNVAWNKESITAIVEIFKNLGVAVVCMCVSEFGDVEIQEEGEK